LIVNIIINQKAIIAVVPVIFNSYITVAMSPKEINDKIKEVIEKFQDFFKKLIINDEDKLETIKFLEKFLTENEILSKAFHLVLGVIYNYMNLCIFIL